MSDSNFMILGLTLIVVGVFTFVFCVGIPILIVGIVVLIYGAAVDDRRPFGYFAPPGYAGWPPPVAAVCPVCGTPLHWVTQYQRWYCARCLAYR